GPKKGRYDMTAQRKTTATDLDDRLDEGGGGFPAPDAESPAEARDTDRARAADGDDDVQHAGDGASANPDGGRGATADPAWLEDLVGRWKTQGRADVELRHHTGACLNAQLGPPDKRRRKDACKVRDLAVRLNVSVREVSRMGHFAEAFPDLGRF